MVSAALTMKQRKPSSTRRFHHCISAASSLTRFGLPFGLLSRRAPVQPVVAPTVTIPAYERWVPSQFWDDALVKPESVAQPQSVVMESVLKDCQKLDASAQVLLDRCNGFANVKGVMSS